MFAENTSYEVLGLGSCPLFHWCFCFVQVYRLLISNKGEVAATGCGMVSYKMVKLKLCMDKNNWCMDKIIIQELPLSSSNCKLCM